MSDPPRCVLAEQVAACVGLVDGAECHTSSIPSGGCAARVCVPHGCGNGILEPGEVCDDGNAIDGDGCRHDCLSTERCGNALVDSEVGEECDCGDGSVPPQTAACNGSPNSEAPDAYCRIDCKRARCGDGIRDTSEVCEGSDLGGATCVTLDYYGGTLACDATCQFDTSGCVGRCGDGVRDPQHEQCDMSDLGNTDCTAFGYYTAAGLTCNALCGFDYMTCTGGRCGDGVKNGPEVCDASDLGGADCTTLGYYFAPGLRCNAACDYDASACTGQCGDGVVNGPELCDGSAPAESCSDVGFDGGTLGCSGQCEADLSQCVRYAWQPIASNTPGTLYFVWGAGNDVFIAGGNAFLHGDGSSFSPIVTNTGFTAFYGVWGTSATNVYIVGQGGVIGHWDGTTFATMTSGTTNDLFAIWGSSATDIYAVGRFGTIQHFDGTSWSAVTSPTTDDLHAIWGSSAGNVFAAGGSGYLLRYNGASWSVTTQIPTVFSGMWGSGPSDIYATGSAGEVAHWNGTAWSVINTPVGTTFDFYGVYGNSATDIFFVGQSGLVLHYDGKGFARLPSGTTQNLYGVWGSSASRVLAVGTGGTIFRYGGTSVASIPTGAGACWALWASAANNAYVSCGSAMYRFDGLAMTSVATGTTSWIHAVWGSSATDIFGVGDAGTIIHSTGGAFTTMTSGTTAALYGAWGFGPSDVYASGNDSIGGKIYHYNGSTWSQSGAVLKSIFALWGTSTTDVFGVGVNGYIVHFDGTSWTAMTSPTSRDLHGVWGTSSSNVYAVGDVGAFIHYDGTSWQTVPAGTFSNLQAVTGSGVGDIFVAGANVLLHQQPPIWVPMLGVTTTLHAAFVRPDVAFFTGDGGALTRLLRTEVTCSGTETACTDHWDDDCDGKIDACDPDCAGVVTEQCANGFDDDCDGLVDCDDPDCATSKYCVRGGSCQPDVAIHCGDTVTGTTVGASALQSSRACDPRAETGPEVYYRLDATTASTATVTLSGYTQDLDLVAVGTVGTPACDPTNACLAASSTTAATETVSFATVAGQSYYIVVDGFNGAADGFTLALTCQ